MKVCLKLHDKSKGELPESGTGRRVIVYAPEYENSDAAMLHRIVDSHFVKMMTDVRYWAYVDEIAPIEGD